MVRRRDQDGPGPQPDRRRPRESHNRKSHNRSQTLQLEVSPRGLSARNALDVRQAVGDDGPRVGGAPEVAPPGGDGLDSDVDVRQDRKSTRLNSSHLVISYAVFCLKKKKQ